MSTSSQSIPFLILILAITTIPPIAAFTTTAVLRGVPAKNLPIYTSSTTHFKCLQSHMLIPIAAINDDYCDCDDGTDEPGTSACSHHSSSIIHHLSSTHHPSSTQFFCLNKYYISQFISLTFVDDGLCDCCDGSDEGEGVCHNTCRDQGHVLKSNLNLKLVKLHDGIEKYQAYVTEAKGILTEAASVVASSKTEVETKQAEIATLQNLLEIEDQLDKIAKDLYDRSMEAYNASLVENAARGASTEGLTEGLTETPTPAPFDIPPPPPPFQSQSNAESLRSQLAPLTSSVTALTTTIQEKTQLLDMDFGNNSIFLPLRNKCFSYFTHEYEYEVCLFKSVTQKSISNQSRTSLGTWKQWKANDNHNKSVGNMDGNGGGGEYEKIGVYENGQSCWQGPSRSTNITFLCGSSDSVVNVTEPEKCVYAIVMTSPAACDMTIVKEIQEQLDALTVHDEL